MRIAHVTQWFIPGMSYQENFLPQEQARLGHDVWMLTSDCLPPPLRPILKHRFCPGDIETDSVKICRLTSKAIGNRAQVYLHQLMRKLGKIEPDCVHLHGLWMLPTLQMAAQNPGYHTVADDHADNGNLPIGIGADVRFTIARGVCRGVVRNGGKILASNPYSMWFVTKVLRTPLEKVFLLPLGINSRSFYPDFRLRNEGRKKLGLERNEMVFVTSGRLTAGKGFELLLRAFAEVFRSFRSVRLIFVGSGSQEYETHLRRLGTDLSIETALIFLKWMSQDELCTYYNAADVGVMPGKIGGIKEILGVGRPLIVPDHLATNYFVENGNGERFRQDDQGSLAEAMRHYVENQELLRKHGERSLEIARNDLSWKRIAEMSLKFYSSS